MALPLEGTEYGAECYCGVTLGSGSALVGTDCGGMVCAGNRSEMRWAEQGKCLEIKEVSGPVRDVPRAGGGSGGF